MAPSVICCILLQLFLLVTANDILTINPQNPIVPLGGSIKLNCSINSPSCTTNWKGLDTNLGSVYTAPGYSILTIQNASISMEGIKICIKTCPDRKNLDTHVSLQVYALPETLLLSTGTTNGISYLHCLMKGIYPMVDIDVQCYRDSEKLGNSFEDISYDDELEIFNITWSWEISNEDLKPQTLYRCEAGLSIGEQTFRRVGILEIPKEARTTDTLARTVTDTENQNTAMSTRRPKTFSTTTDLTTLYTRTPKKWNPSPLSTSSSVTTHKQFPTSDTVRATDTLDATMTSTENQDTSMRTPTTFSTSIDSTTVYIGTPKEKSPSPLSTTFSSVTPHKKHSTTNTVSNAENQTTVMTTRTSTTQRSLSTLISSTEFSSPTTHKVPPHPDRVRATDTLGATMTNTENQDTSMRTPTTFFTSIDSTTVYTGTPKEKSPSPLSTMFSSVTPHKEYSTTNTVSNAENQTTVMTTRTPTTQRTLSTPISSTEFSSPTTHKVPPHPDRDDINIIWMAVPAVGLAGSILLFLQIWRQLNKKGFFQPNQTHWTDCKHGVKDLVYSLETGSSHYRSVR